MYPHFTHAVSAGGRANVALNDAVGSDLRLCNVSLIKPVKGSKTELKSSSWTPMSLLVARVVLLLLDNGPK